MQSALAGICYDDHDDNDDDFDIWSVIVVPCFVMASLNRPPELSSTGLQAHPVGRKVG